MARLSSQVMAEINAMGSMPDYQQEITKQYEGPVLKPITQERESLEAQYLPTLFQPFTEWGTGAADMSPAAKLATIGTNMGQLGARIGSSNRMLDFFGGEIGRLADRMSQDWQIKLSNKWNEYNALAQAEQAAAARAAAAANAFDWSKLFGSDGRTSGASATAGGTAKASNLRWDQDPNNPVTSVLMGLTAPARGLIDALGGNSGQARPLADHILGVAAAQDKAKAAMQQSQAMQAKMNDYVDKFLRLNPQYQFHDIRLAGGLAPFVSQLKSRGMGYNW